MYSNEIYHAAFNILSNRAEQIGEDELYHHGVIGQKWGVRRYQNEDGTRTEAGRKHRNQTNEKKSEEDISKARKRKAVGTALGLTVAAATVAYVVPKLHGRKYAKGAIDDINQIIDSAHIQIDDLADFLKNETDSDRINQARTAISKEKEFIQGCENTIRKLKKKYWIK